MSLDWSNCVKLENFEDDIVNSTIEDETKYEEEIKIEDLLKISLDNCDKKSKDLLHYQSILISYLYIYCEKKIFDNYVCKSNNRFEINTTFNLNIIIDILQWLCNCSNLLANRIGQEKITLENNGEIIKRSGYTFCQHSSQCPLFYIDNKLPCENQHYVHNQVEHDIKSLLEYFKTYKQDTDIDTTTKINIKKSLNTIKYVIDHMYSEIYDIECKIGNSEKYHTLINKSKKNVSQRYQKNNQFDNKHISKEKSYIDKNTKAINTLQRNKIYSN